MDLPKTPAAQVPKHMTEKRLAYHRKWRKDNPQKQRNYKAKQRIENPAKDMLRMLKCQAKRKGIPFNIEESDINPLPTLCPVLGIKLDYSAHSLQDNCPSVDKIVPTKGYTKGNIKVISLRANRIKHNATPEELCKVYHYSLEVTHAAV